MLVSGGFAKMTQNGFVKLVSGGFVKDDTEWIC